MKRKTSLTFYKISLRLVSLLNYLCKLLTCILIKNRCYVNLDDLLSITLLFSLILKCMCVSLLVFVPLLDRDERKRIQEKKEKNIYKLKNIYDKENNPSKSNKLIY